MSGQFIPADFDYFDYDPDPATPDCVTIFEY
jgi:hypothetical protein